ncbi:SCO1431 family membrane protein [Streptomyces termitum]|uniref:SCO1431 family membrane protein n=1 Tax=Streptomyces termitum TaxID=67368 RepID=UPI0037B79BA7
MSATHTLTARLGARARTGGPKDDDRGPELLEHALGWILVVLVAVLVTRAGLM